MMDAMVGLMVRIPVPGAVKTRLIPRLGPSGACQLYQAMVEDILVQVKTSGLSLTLFFTGGELHQLPAAWQAQAEFCEHQQGQDLGARMDHALALCHQRASRVILIGSDIPDMTSEVLLQALEALKRSSLVLTPARDGGYCLLGTRKEAEVRSILTNMVWSTDQVLLETLRRLRLAGQEFELLSPLRDMDTAEDLAEYANNPRPEALMTNRVLADFTTAL